jgi:7-cyano-7-deazaguanine reductase
MRMKVTNRPTKISGSQGLETFTTPSQVTEITCSSDEVTAICPETGRADWYRVEITYRPRDLCVESKSVGLFLQSFRSLVVSCEFLSSAIATVLHRVLRPYATKVVVTQKPRGGVSIQATAVVGGLPT